METDYIPKDLAFLSKVISEYSVTEVKILPDCGNNAISHAQKFTVGLPVDGLIDLRSFTMYSQVTVADLAAYLPPAEMLINQLEVTAAGQQIDRIDYYGDLFCHLNNVTSSTPHSTNRHQYSNEPRAYDLPLTTDVISLELTVAAATATCHIEMNAILDRIRAAVATDRDNINGSTGAVIGEPAALTVFTTNEAVALIAKIVADQTAIATALGLPGYDVATTAAVITSTAVGDVRALIYGQMNGYMDNVRAMLKVYARSGGSVAIAGTKNFVINSWLGFLGTNSHKLIDTATMPKLTVGITLAPYAVLGSATGTYTLTANSTYFTVKVIKFARFQAALYSALGSGISLDFYFDRWVNQLDGMTATQTTHRTTINSSNIQRIFVTQKALTYGTQAAKADGTLLSNYFQYPRYNTTDVYWDIGTVRVPQYPIDLTNYGYFHLLKELGVNNDSTYDSLIETNSEYHNQKFLHAISFTYGYEPGVIAGQDTNGMDKPIQFNRGTASGTAGYLLFMIQCTSNLQVMPGKVVRVVV